MGLIQHMAVIATTWDDAAAQRLRDWQKVTLIRLVGADDLAMARGIGLVECRPVMNGYITFLLPPDGSKEGWAHSELGDKVRAALIQWLVTDAIANGKRFEWIEIEYGECGPGIGLHNISDSLGSGQMLVPTFIRNEE